MMTPSPRRWRRSEPGRWQLRTDHDVLAEARQIAGRWRWRLIGDDQEGIAGNFDGVSVAVHRALRDRAVLTLRSSARSA